MCLLNSVLNQFIACLSARCEPNHTVISGEIEILSFEWNRPSHQANVRTFCSINRVWFTNWREMLSADDSKLCQISFESKVLTFCETKFVACTVLFLTLMSLTSATAHWITFSVRQRISLAGHSNLHYPMYTIWILLLLALSTTAGVQFELISLLRFLKWPLVDLCFAVLEIDLLFGQPQLLH